MVQTPTSPVQGSEIFLSWDPQSCVTSGYFSYDRTESNLRIMYNLRHLGSQLRLPTAPMLLIHRFCVLNRYMDYLLALRHVNNVLKLGTLDPSDALDHGIVPLDLAALHNMVLDASLICNGGKGEFLLRLEDALASCIDGISQLEDTRDDHLLQTNVREVRHHLDQLLAATQSVESGLELLAARIDLCMRVVCCRSP